MINFESAKGLFADKNVFGKLKPEHGFSGKFLGYRVEILGTDDDGWHYDFYIKKTEYGNGAIVGFGKWNPLYAGLVCEIYDMTFLKNVIDTYTHLVKNKTETT